MPPLYPPTSRTPTVGYNSAEFSGRTVGKEGEEEQAGPNNPALVEVQVSRANMVKFKADGKLK